VIPGTIISGIAGILMWQNATGRWFSWAYVWTLIPGFVGLALFVFSLVSPREGANKDVRLASRWLMGISLALFLVFTTFLSPMRWFWAVLALALIGTGGYLIIRSRRSGQPAGKS
jgi:bacteriorhodopsin